MKKNIVLTLLLTLSIADLLIARDGGGRSGGGMSHGGSAGRSSFSGSRGGVSRSTDFTRSSGSRVSSAGVARSGSRSRVSGVNRSGQRWSDNNWRGNRNWNRNRYWGWNNGAWGWINTSPFIYVNTYYDWDLIRLQRELDRLQYELAHTTDPEIIYSLQIQIDALQRVLNSRF